MSKQAGRQAHPELTSPFLHLCVFVSSLSLSIKIWDARNFSCCQSFESMSQISSFTACSQRHKRIFVVGKCHEMSIYEQEGGPFLRRKQEEPIFAAVYSPWTMTICTANREDVKVNTKAGAISTHTHTRWHANRKHQHHSDCSANV